eukprot:764949-Hanusia_phi.AAC.2
MGGTRRWGWGSSVQGYREWTGGQEMENAPVVSHCTDCVASHGGSNTYLGVGVACRGCFESGIAGTPWGRGRGNWGLQGQGGSLAREPWGGSGGEVSAG